VISPSQRPLPNNTQHSQQTDIHVTGGNRTHNPSKRAVADLSLKPRGHWDQHIQHLLSYNVKLLTVTVPSPWLYFTLPRLGFN